MAHLQNWANTIEEADVNGIAKQRIEGSGANLVRVVVPAGTFAARHHHDYEQFVQVISGSGDLETEDGIQQFGPGSVSFFPPATWHSARFATETVLIETNLRK